MRSTSVTLAALACLLAPAALFAWLAPTVWVARPPSERAIARAAVSAFAGATLAITFALAQMLRTGATEARISLGTLFGVAHYGMSLELVLDRLSLPFAAFSAALVAIIAAFSARYLHRERGFTRFYLLLSLFGAGVQLVVLAGTLDLIVVGWELVGLSSALLIAFFDERTAPVRHGLRAYVTYRACDVGLLAGAVWLHHSAGSTAITPDAAIPFAGLVVPADATDATLVGLLLLWAAMGKSAQVPLGGWLPRAMEGPTPSSAIFYGALSVHLGPYLLLRAAPLLERTPIVAAAVVVIGALTALHATFVGRAQADIKSALAYASMTQVGLIFVEIGLGLRYVALLHIVGHACVRTLQLLRAPSLLHDHHHLERAMGAHLPRTGVHFERLVPARLAPWLYRLALERGYLDSWLADYVLGGAVRLLRSIDRIEQRWVCAVEGRDKPVREERQVTR